MNKAAYTVLAAALFFATVSLVQGQSTSMYTWTDENGVVHFSDTRPADTEAMEMETPEAYLPGSSDAYPEADQLEEAEQADPELVESYADTKRAEFNADREAYQLNQAERQSKCQQAREQLETIEPSRRVFFVNDQGETERLNDEERVRMVAEAKQVIADNCD